MLAMQLLNCWAKFWLITHLLGFANSWLISFTQQLGCSKLTQRRGEKMPKDQEEVPRDPRFVFRTFYYFRLRFFDRYFF